MGGESSGRDNGGKREASLESESGPAPAPVDARRATPLAGRGRILFIGFSWSVLVLLVVSFVWAADKGLDLSDESYYLLSYRFPHVASAGVTQFQFIVNALTFGHPLGMSGYRILGMGTLLAASVVLMLSFLRFLEGRLPEYREAMPSRSALCAFGATAGLLGLTWLPRAISYNTLSTVLGELVVGAILWATASPRGNSWHPRPVQLVLSAAAGSALAVLLFDKFPAAIMVGLLTVVFLFVAAGWRQGLVLGVGVGVGGLAAIFLMSNGVLGGSFSLQALRDGAAIASEGSHGPKALLADYARQAASIGLRSALSIPAALLGLTFAAPVIARFAPERLRFALGWALAIPGPVVVALVWRSRWEARAIPYDVVFMILGGFAIGMVLVVLASAGPVATTPAPSRVLLAGLVLLLLALPLATSFGTANDIFLQSISGGASFACVIALAWAGRGMLLAPDGRETVLSYVPLLFTSAMFALFVTLGGGFLHPYRVTGSVLDQTRSLSEVHGISGLKVDPTTARMLAEIQTKVAAISSYRSGDPLIAGVGLEGVALALGGWLPGVEFYTDEPMTCLMLERAPRDLARTDLVIRDARVKPGLNDCLERIMPGYPEGFDVKGTVDGRGDERLEILVRRKI